MPKEDLLKSEMNLQKVFNILSRYTHPTIDSIKNPQRCNFFEIILYPVIDNCVDVQRMIFYPEDSVTGLMFSEFRLQSRELNREIN
ncbi:MAG: hypothetical protein A2158_05650 [Chloroflexi bacterium RBG_13_46_14]|nr:MAG: hypothetical protein A2158_05650 [Chloroflexi bacterium RBG_13_46_14]